MPDVLGAFRQTKSSNSATSWLSGLAAGLLLLIGATCTPAFAESPGSEALRQYKEGNRARQAVENRFFLKEGRFEVSPMVGYVPNNPFARRYLLGGTLGLHFSETLSAQVSGMYSPDLAEGDVKPLTSILLDRAHQAADEDAPPFQQPLDKAALTFAAGVAWAPLYGKINLVGEKVLNFDLYLFAGVGMISKRNYFATYDDSSSDPQDILNLAAAPTFSEVKVAPYIGLGQNYFVNRLMAVKLDVRGAFYVDNKPQYDPTAGTDELGLRLYNNVIASVGVSVFLPNMKPRLYNY
jgi:outer membrane beta-barrel protein